MILSIESSLVDASLVCLARSSSDSPAARLLGDHVVQVGDQHFLNSGTAASNPSTSTLSANPIADGPDEEHQAELGLAHLVAQSRGQAVPARPAH